MVLLSLLLCGCKNLGKPDNRYDLLEAELRTRERELQETRAERDHLRLLANTYERQGPTTFPAAPVYRPDSGMPTLPLQTITLGSGTGGVDEDRRPGDESLQVVIVPKDDDGTAVKVPGRATVQAFEVSREGLKICIGQWNVTAEQLKKTWKSGFLSSGYFVPLQWDKLPSTDRVRLVVRFSTLDGREYEADKDVTVRPLPTGGVMPSIPSPGVPEELPPPPGLPEPAARLRVPRG